MGRWRQPGWELVSETDCTAFLQWALPQLDLHWPGFRKVRRQVCKRLRLRMSELQLADFAAYLVHGSKPTRRSGKSAMNVATSRSRGSSVTGGYSRSYANVLPDIAARAQRNIGTSAFGRPAARPARNPTR
jgi:chemotaxis protein methyltransferase CheR